MPNFRFLGGAIIEHINLRKQETDRGEVLAADLKLVTLQHIDEVAPFFDSALRRFLYTASGAPRVPSMEAIRYGVMLENYCMQVFAERLRGCKVKKFTLRPMVDLGVIVGFQVSFISPSALFFSRLAERLNEKITLELAPSVSELSFLEFTEEEVVERADISALAHEK